MDIPVYNNITTIEALGATIQNDYQVSSWFSLLLNTPVIRNFLTSGDEETRNTQIRLSALIRLKERLIFLFGGLLLTALLLPYYFIWGGIAALLIGGIITAHRKETAAVQKLALVLVPHDFDRQSLGHRTLYQITEFYAREYNIPSLIETINISIRVTRDTAIAFLILTLLIIPLPSFSFGRILIMLLGYPLAQHAFVKHLLQKRLRTERPAGRYRPGEPGTPSPEKSAGE